MYKLIIADNEEATRSRVSYKDLHSIKPPNMAIRSYSNETHGISDDGKRREFVKFVPGGAKHGRK